MVMYPNLKIEILKFKNILYKFYNYLHEKKLFNEKFYKLNIELIYFLFINLGKLSLISFLKQKFQ